MPRAGERCPSCGLRLARDVLICPHCGAPTTEITIEPAVPDPGVVGADVVLGGPPRPVRRRPPGDGGATPDDTARWAARGGETTPATPDGPPGRRSRRWTRGRVRRPGALVVVVAAFVLAAAVLVNRGGGTATETAPTTVPTTVPTTTAAPTTTTVRPPRPRATTTTAPATLGDGSPLLGEPSGLVLFRWVADFSRRGDASGAVERVDLDTGARSTSLDDVGFSPRVLAVPGGVAVDDGNVIAALDTKGATRCQLPSALQIVPGAQGIWLVVRDRQGATTASLVADLDTCAPTTPVAVPAGAEPVGELDGALVVQAAAGGAYRLDPAGGGATLVTAGRLLAAAGGRYVALTCDDPSTCRQTVTDAAGASRVVAEGPGAASSIPVLSPDGHWLAWLEQDPTSRLPSGAVVVVDLATDARETIGTARADVGFPTGPNAAALPLAWSSDGRWLLFADGSTLRAWRPGLHDAVQLPAPGGAGGAGTAGFVSFAAVAVGRVSAADAAALVGPRLGEASGLAIYVWGLAPGTGADGTPVDRFELDDQRHRRVVVDVGALRSAGAVPGGVAFAGDQTVVVRPDGSEQCQPFATTGVVIATSDGFWLVGQGQAVRIETGWCAMHGAVPLPASAVPVGTQHDRLLVDTGGAISEIDASSGQAVPLATGRLESATGDYAVVRRCDPTARCPMVLLGPGPDRPLLDGAAALDTHAVVAPDGAHVALLRGAPPAEDGTGGWSLAVLDVSTGLQVQVADRIAGTAEAVAAGGFGTVAQWSPDGRWLVYATPDGLAAWRPGAAVPLEITGGRPVAGFVLAPASGGAV